MERVMERNRRSIRLHGFDYGQAGAYFVTVCTKNRESLFGNVAGGEMVLNQAGEIVRDEWMHTWDIRPDVWPDYFMVMPNHFHAIVAIVRNDRDVSKCRGVLQYAPTTDRIRGDTADRIRLASPSCTLGAIVRGFKSATTTRINQMRATPGMPVWQRNYHERIIRKPAEMARIREYIAMNPANWATDENNPAYRYVGDSRAFHHVGRVSHDRPR
ncbi:MAG: transposase [Nitrospirota bacterium]